MGNGRQLNVGIIGTGKIGTDLLIKIQRSEYLNCVLFAGRNLDSAGMKKALDLGVNISDKSINAFTEYNGHIDVVFDATSAEHHRKHAPIFKELGIKAIDLTPAKVGGFCVPCLNDQVLQDQDNVNMVTCGGQASIPMATLLKGVYPSIKSLKIESFLSPDSIGPATIANIDDYYATTAQAVSFLSEDVDVKVDLHVDEKPGRSDMLTVITAKVDQCDVAALTRPLAERLAKMQSYVPGYKLQSQPRYENGELIVEVSVRGQGDWIPEYAGNLDIINCAALVIAEKYAMARSGVAQQAGEYEEPGMWQLMLNRMRGMFG